jgi:hypothetical protein
VEDKQKKTRPMKRNEAAQYSDLMLAHLSVDEDCGEGATAKLYAELMADIWPTKEDFTDDDVAGFMVQLMALEPTP